MSKQPYAIVWNVMNNATSKSLAAARTTPACGQRVQRSPAPVYGCVLGSASGSLNRLSALKRAGGGDACGFRRQWKQRLLLFKISACFLNSIFGSFRAKEDAESFALVLQLSGFKLRDILKLCSLRKQFSSLFKKKRIFHVTSV